MMPNVSRGDRMDGLIRYLVGPGRRNEHTDPHLVNGSPSIMAWFDDAQLDVDAALRIAKELDHPYRAYGVEPYGGHVWHCSLSVKAEEGQLGDERWAEIADAFMHHMGFLDDAKAPVRWVGIHHGQTLAGNDHIHLAVELVREDGTKASTWNDQPRAQAACRAIEQQFGLQAVEGRAIGMGERGRRPRAWDAAKRTGAAETYEERLERTVRAVAAAAGSEAEFVRGLREARLLVRPRWAEGGQDVVTGYSVADRPPRGQKPQWRGGGRLAKDLSLPALRDAHWRGVDDDPVAAVHAVGEAVGEWRAAWRNKRKTAGYRLPEIDPADYRRHAERIAELRERLRNVPPGDVGHWSAVAHHLSGAFAAWSLVAEGDQPGPLARTAATLSRTAQVPRSWHDQDAHNLWGPSIRGVSLILASAAKGGRGPVGIAVLLRQLANTAKALHDAHVAEDRAMEARAIARAMVGDLEAVRGALPSEGLRRAADREEIAAGATVGGGHPRPAGSPVPGRLQPHRSPERTGGTER